MMKRRISLLALLLLSITGCLDMSDQDHPEGISPQEIADTTSDIAATSSSATPDAFPASCPSGIVCLYQNSNFGGAKLVIPAGASVSSFVRSGFNPDIASWCNHTIRRYCYWSNINFLGTRVTISATSCGLIFPANRQASSAGPC
jgi:hypothetical protein